MPIILTGVHTPEYNCIAGYSAHNILAVKGPILIYIYIATSISGDIAEVITLTVNI